MEGYAIARQNGWMSANDIRALENQNPIPKEEGGDAYLVNGNMIPITTAMQAKTEDQLQTLLSLRRLPDPPEARAYPAYLGASAFVISQAALIRARPP